MKALKASGKFKTSLLYTGEDRLISFDEKRPEQQHRKLWLLVCYVLAGQG
jgi:hypothetical protein